MIDLIVITFNTSVLFKRLFFYIVSNVFGWIFCIVKVMLVTFLVIKILQSMIELLVISFLRLVFYIIHPTTESMSSLVHNLLGSSMLICFIESSRFEALSIVPWNEIYQNFEMDILDIRWCNDIPRLLIVTTLSLLVWMSKEFY